MSHPHDEPALDSGSPATSTQAVPRQPTAQDVADAVGADDVTNAVAPLPEEATQAPPGESTQVPPVEATRVPPEQAVPDMASAVAPEEKPGQAGPEGATSGDGPEQAPIPAAPRIRRRRIAIAVGLVLAVLATTAILYATTADDATLATPDRIGSWSKATDQESNELARRLVLDVDSSHPVLVLYANEERHTALIWGGDAGSGTADQQLDALVSEHFVEPGSMVAVETGPVGGRAKCREPDPGDAGVICAWTGDGKLLGFRFSDASTEDAAAQLRELLAAIVTR